jgi:hypothetical protein
MQVEPKLEIFMLGLGISTFLVVVRVNFGLFVIETGT